MMQFLMGLNDSFAMCRSHILMMDPLPLMDRVFSMVVQFERQNGLSPDDDENQVMINVADSTKNYARGRGGYNNKVCTYCGKNGHTIETCYRKNGFPPGFKFKNGNNPSVNCDATNDDLDGKNEDAKSIKDLNFATLSQEEYKALISLLQSNNMRRNTKGQQV